MTRAYPFPSSPSGQLIRSRRLAVVRGLVLDRTQNMSVGQPILKSYFSRANYGFLCVEPYNSEKHLLQDTYRDWDNKLYVNNQIHWVVKKVSQPTAHLRDCRVGV